MSTPSNHDWTLDDCVQHAKHEAHVASCEFLDRPCQATEIELGIAGRALAQLEKMAAKSIKPAIAAAMLLLFGLQQSFAGDTPSTPNVERLVTAIGKAENSKRYPYGIIAKRQLTEQEARRWCVNTVNHGLADWRKAGSPGDPIDWISKTYAPIGAKNDPKALNKNWSKNVKKFYGRKI
jgi:hypothetical protein